MIDIESLLQPINETSPCGEDMSFSSEFDQISEARRFDDPHLEQGEWQTDLKEADWKKVVQLSSQLLTKRTKDLRLSAWLIEALAMTQGYEGLAQSYRVFSGLCENYWDSVYPLPDGHDYDERLGVLSWLLVRSQELLKSLPLTQSQKGVFSLADWERAKLIAQRIQRGDSDAQPAGAVSVEEVDAARLDTPANFYQDSLQHIEATIETVTRLEATIDAHLPEDGISFTPLKEALKNSLDVLKRFGKEVGMSIAPVESVETNSSATNSSTASSHTHGQPALSSMTTVQAPLEVGPLQGRAQALVQLRQVAEFFRRTEPHSPVAYLADKAAKWGDMPLHVWLKNVVKDQSALAHVEELLGLQTGEENSN